MKSEQGFFQNNFSFLGFQIISIFDWILGLYVRERFVSINGVYNCSSKFDVPAHFGNGNHSFWLLSKIHYPQLIAFDFSNYISFLDVVLFWKAENVTGRNHMFPYFWNVAETCNSMFPLCLTCTKSGPVPLYTQQRKREKTSRNR